MPGVCMPPPRTRLSCAPEALFLPRLAQAFLDDAPSGEAMERVGMDAAGWSLLRGDSMAERAGRRRKMQVWAASNLL